MDLLPFSTDPLYVTEDDSYGRPQCSSWVWQMGGTQQISVIKGPEETTYRRKGLFEFIIPEDACLVLCPFAEHNRSLVWRAAMHNLIGSKQGTRL